MLENLLNTKLKKRLLALLFAIPTRSFSASELRTITGGTSPTIKQVLKEFEAAELVSTAARRQKKYYRINPYFRLYDEIRDLVVEEDLPGEDEVGRILKKIPHVKLVILSGIFTLQPNLPADIIVVGDGINRLRLQRAILEIEKLTGQEINYSILDQKEFEYRRMMNDRFIRDVLDYPHLVVVGSLK